MRTPEEYQQLILQTRNKIRQLELDLELSEVQLNYFQEQMRKALLPKKQ